MIIVDTCIATKINEISDDNLSSSAMTIRYKHRLAVNIHKTSVSVIVHLYFKSYRGNIRVGTRYLKKSQHRLLCLENTILPLLVPCGDRTRNSVLWSLLAPPCLSHWNEGAFCRAKSFISAKFVFWSPPQPNVGLNTLLDLKFLKNRNPAHIW